MRLQETCQSFWYQNDYSLNFLTNMIGPIISQLASQAGQLVSQAGKIAAQELSKPHNQAHIAKAIGEIINGIKKKK